jgi:hypothetical protein
MIALLWKSGSNPLGYVSVPACGGLAPEKRSRWKAHLAQKFKTRKTAQTR